MAEASRGRVTITLGRSGQVVNRSVSASDVSFSDSVPRVGTKRSVRDRLGRSDEDGYLLNGSLVNGTGKRRRDNTGRSSSRADDVFIEKGDLRLKLMRKGVSRRARSNEGKPEDLRDKLKKAVQHPISATDSRRHMYDAKEKGGFGRIPSRRSADDLTERDSDRSLYSSLTMESFRRRSPERIAVASRGFSPQRSAEEGQRRPSNRTFDDVRSVLYMGKDVIDTSRPMTSLPLQSKAALPPGSLKPVAPLHLGQLPPPSSFASKSSYMVDEQQTVDGLLHSLGLGKYVVIFKAEEVDMTALKQMGENDLKELGIPMGPRKKILLSLLPRPKRQP